MTEGQADFGYLLLALVGICTFSIMALDEIATESLKPRAKKK